MTFVAAVSREIEQVVWYLEGRWFKSRLLSDASRAGVLLNPPLGLWVKEVVSAVRAEGQEGCNVLRGTLGLL